MRDCLVLGSGRSGTSLVAGVLHQSGYFTGHDLLPASPTNPRGFFEDREVNAINEALLERVLPGPPLARVRHPFFPDRPRFGQRWLAALPPETAIPPPSNGLKNRMSRVVARH